MTDETFHPEPIFSWLHLSDIHFGHGDKSNQIDQELVTNLVKSDVKSLCNARDIPIDLILVTGDISATGGTRSSNEFDLAAEFLSDLAQYFELQDHQVLHVPGNHDVQRNVAHQDSDTSNLLTILRTGAKKLDNALAIDKEKSMLSSRFANYFEFADKFGAACKDITGWKNSISGPFGLNFRFAGLNTALLSQDRLDHNHLMLGMEQIKTALNSGIATPNEIVVVLSHHPFDWIGDHEAASSWIDQHAHFHLFGHNHLAAYEHVSRSGKTPIIKVATGAIHSDEREDDINQSPVGHSYNICTFHVSKSGRICARIWPRVWSSKNKIFMLDVENVDADQLYCEHTLPISVAHESVDEMFDSMERMSSVVTLAKNFNYNELHALEKYLKIATGDDLLSLNVAGEDDA